MKVNVQCISKNERMEGNKSVADITLSPIQANLSSTGAIGAVVGTPNAPTATDGLQEYKEVQYNLNGALSFTVRDESTIQDFKVGSIYEISVDVKTPEVSSSKSAK